MSEEELSPRLSPNLNIPELPWNVIRRIIHFRLALTPSIPPRLDAEGPVTTAWDGLAGRIGHKARQRRVEERKDAMSAVGLLRVCKAWKNIILKYIYTEPHLTDSTFFPFVQVLLRGDKKWDDLRIHPHSLPARYITTLDLSSLSRLVDPGGTRSVVKALQEILPILPNITHLKLPPYHPTKDRLLCVLEEAPCLRNLRALQGLRLDDAYETSIMRELEVYRLLARCRKLEYLALESIGHVGLHAAIQDYTGDLTLDLPRLHTLELEHWTPGLLAVLTRSELPALQHLITEVNYYDLDKYNFPTLPSTFKKAHAHKIVALTILPMPPGTEGMLRWASIPSGELLDDHPNLRHLSLLSPPFEVIEDNDDDTDAQIFAASLVRRNHPLSHITLHKWNHPDEYPLTPCQMGLSTISFVPENAGHSYPRTSQILDAIISRRPPNLECITIDGNTWASPKLPKAALSTGISGEMRTWSSKLRTHGIILRDMEGNEAPALREEENGQGRGRRMSRNNDQRMDRAIWDPYRGATRRAQSRRQGDDQDGG